MNKNTRRNSSASQKSKEGMKSKAIG